MMENWLRSGIDKSVLEEEFENFKRKKFPLAPEEDELYDLFSELAELDGHVAGLVSSYLKNKKINFKLLDVDDEFNRILSNIVSKSESIEDIIEYKKNLDKFILMIKIIEGLTAE